MNKIIILLVAAIPALAAPGFDFKQLDKLGAKAKNSTSISLEGPVLKMASGLLGKDKNGASVKSLIDGLKGVYIRSFEFDESGKYNRADLDPLRAWLDAQNWTRIVDTTNAKEFSAIYVLTLPDGQAGGFAIVAAEPKEVNIVFIEGVVSLNDIAKLSGNMGIPEMSILENAKHAAKSQKDK